MTYWQFMDKLTNSGFFSDLHSCFRRDPAGTWFGKTGEDLKECSIPGICGETFPNVHALLNNINCNQPQIVTLFLGAFFGFDSIFPGNRLVNRTGQNERLGVKVNWLRYSEANPFAKADASTLRALLQQKGESGISDSLRFAGEKTMKALCFFMDLRRADDLAAALYRQLFSSLDDIANGRAAAEWAAVSPKVPRRRRSVAYTLKDALLCEGYRERDYEEITQAVDLNVAGRCDRVREYADMLRNGKNVAITGQIGAGKTLFTLNVAGRLAKDDAGFVYVSLYDYSSPAYLEKLLGERPEDKSPVLLNGTNRVPDDLKLSFLRELLAIRESGRAVLVTTTEEDLFAGDGGMEVYTLPLLNDRQVAAFTGGRPLKGPVKQLLRVPFMLQLYLRSAEERSRGLCAAYLLDQVFRKLQADMSALSSGGLSTANRRLRRLKAALNESIPEFVYREYRRRQNAYPLASFRAAVGDEAAEELAEQGIVYVNSRGTVQWRSYYYLYFFVSRHMARLLAERGADFGVLCGLFAGARYPDPIYDLLGEMLRGVFDRALDALRIDRVDPELFNSRACADVTAGVLRAYETPGRSGTAPDLRGLNLGRACLSGIDLSRADLTDSLVSDLTFFSPSISSAPHRIVPFPNGYMAVLGNWDAVVIDRDLNIVSHTQYRDLIDPSGGLDPFVCACRAGDGEILAVTRSGSCLSFGIVYTAGNAPEFRGQKVLWKDGLVREVSVYRGFVCVLRENSLELYSPGKYDVPVQKAGLLPDGAGDGEVVSALVDGMGNVLFTLREGRKIRICARRREGDRVSHAVLYTRTMPVKEDLRAVFFADPGKSRLLACFDRENEGVAVVAVDTVRRKASEKRIELHGPYTMNDWAFADACAEPGDGARVAAGEVERKLLLATGAGRIVCLNVKDAAGACAIERDSTWDRFEITGSSVECISVYGSTVYAGTTNREIVAVRTMGGAPVHADLQRGTYDDLGAIVPCGSHVYIAAYDGSVVRLRREPDGKMVCDKKTKTADAWAWSLCCTEDLVCVGSADGTFTVLDRDLAILGKVKLGSRVNGIAPDDGEDRFLAAAGNVLYVVAYDRSARCATVTAKKVLGKPENCLLYTIRRAGQKKWFIGGTLDGQAALWEAGHGQAGPAASLIKPLKGGMISEIHVPGGRFTACTVYKGKERICRADDEKLRFLTLLDKPNSPVRSAYAYAGDTCLAAVLEEKTGKLAVYRDVQNCCGGPETVVSVDLNSRARGICFAQCDENGAELLAATLQGRVHRIRFTPDGQLLENAVVWKNRSGFSCTGNDLNLAANIDELSKDTLDVLRSFGNTVGAGTRTIL